ncbi:MAG: polyprenol monophosphomannose synthase [Candidatus Omnitrophica bacterium]|nr:polyprenol monophosphomannose synthase [Candidatus Omnitrophota bacterium]
MQTLVVIPTYNERQNLPKLASQILSVLPHTDILVVDDNSPDGTGDLAEKLSGKDHRVKVIHRRKKLGLGSAYIEGFRYALKNNYDFIFEMDADFSHSPTYLPKFLAQAPGHNLILGSRYIEGGGIADWGLWRRTLSTWANRYARKVLKVPYHDLTTGFKCYSRELLKNLKLDSIICEGYGFQIETTYRAHKKGYTIKEIPIVFKGRRKGKSKISRGICVEAIWKIPLLRLLRI